MTTATELQEAVKKAEKVIAILNSCNKIEGCREPIVFAVNGNKDHLVFTVSELNRLIQAATAQQPTAVIADWMIKNGYATGHGDTVDDLLDELVQQQGAPPPVTPDEARRALTLKSFGYAEGHYYHQNCVNCQQSFEADKRALSCKSCAEKLLKSAAGEK